MAKAGKFKLAVTHHGALEAADWLDRFLDHPQPQWALELSAALRKAAMRKRRSGGEFTTQIPRELAHRLAGLREAAVLARTAPPRVIEIMVACGRKPGRPPHILAEKEKREDPTRAVDERHRKRVVRDAKHDRAIRKWNDEHGSLLGSFGTGAVQSFPKK